jgi:hypothetical protein
LLTVYVPYDPYCDSDSASAYVSVESLSTLGISPGSLSFAAGPGTVPSPQFFSVTSTAAPISFGVSINLTSPAPRTWLSSSPNNGTTPRSVQITIDPSVVNFAVGTYTANVVFTDTNSGAMTTATVQLGVTANQILVDQQLMVFGALSNAVAPPIQILDVQTATGLPIQFTSAVGYLIQPPVNWLQTPMATSAPVNLGISVMQAGLSEGLYRGYLTLTDSGNNQALVTVDLIVKATPDVALSFPYQIGGALPPSQSGTVNSAAGSTDPFVAGASSDRGWLLVDPEFGNMPANITVSASPAAILQAGDYHGVVAVTDLLDEADIIAATLNVTAAATPSALPHFAAGDTWTTGFFVINTGSQPAQFSIAFHDDHGNLIGLPFSGGSASTLSGTVPAQGSAYYEAADPQTQLVSGWGQIIADPSIVVQALFRDDSNGTYYEAAVPSMSGTHEFLLPFDATTFAANGSPFFTGFAIANLDQVAANVTCTSRTSGGAVIPNAVLVPALSPLGHWAGFSFLPLTGQRGTIDCVSNTNIAATALRFIGASAFSSLPVISK